MALSLIKSVWENGVLRFRNKATGTPIAAIGTLRLHEYLVNTDIDTQNGTLLAASLAGGLITHTSTNAGGTLTFDTAANIIAAFPGLAIGDAVECYLINDGNQTVTLAQDVGNTTTIADTGQTVAINESCLLLILMTAAATVTVYTIGA